uniref:Uncharacterized protein n=1 Tax=Peronospora matthiolae TaxID=2874970 RepID=A0AAV1TF76_9STRA
MSDRADQLKLQGNTFYHKGKFRAAIDMYTEAIVRVLSITNSTHSLVLC